MRSWFAGALALTASASAVVAAQESYQFGQAFAQEPPAATDVISRILVENNQRIESRTVLSYMLVKAGDSYDAERLDLSLKALVATGLFADVVFERRGGDLVVRVIENPIINRVLFEGNNAVTTEKLEEEAEAEPRATFTRSRVEQDVQRILELYRRAGRFAATVTPQYKPLPQNRADLIFVIDEGPKTGVRAINFLGNETYSDSRLRSEIATRQSKWWRFFEKRDNYNPGQVEYDRELLRDFYTNEGYADFKTVAAVGELTPDRKDFYLTFTIDEGDQYNFGKISVSTELEKLSGERLAQVLPMKENDLFRAKSIEDAIDTITFAAGTAGYANVDVKPVENRDPVTHKIDLKFEVDEGPRVYIERIDIAGNTQTLDRVIRREIRVAEGDAFNRVLLDSAKSRIRALGFFDTDKVEIVEEPGSAEDKTVVKVNVVEKPTGELAFSAGFSSADAFLFSASYTQPNFRGRGQYVSARIQTTSYQQDIEFRFTEPKFQDRNLAVGLDLFLQSTDFAEEAGFKNSIIGAGTRLFFPLSDRSSLGLRYNLRSDDLSIDAALTDCSSTAFFRSSLCDQQGRRLTSSVGYNYTLDKTNDPIEPTRGYTLTFSQEFAGLGGDVKYIKNEFRSATYYGLFKDVVLSGRLEGGLIEGWGDDSIRINNRYFKGGNNFRGFDVAGLGPREVQYYYETETIAVNSGTAPRDVSVPLDADANGAQDVNDTGQLLFTSAVRNADGSLAPTKVRAFNALGGKAYAIGTLQLDFPIPYAPDELGIKGGLFTEFGTVGLLDDLDRQRKASDAFNTFVVDDSASLRASAGVSIYWDSPFGPIRFDFSKILASEEYDNTETFRFSTNTRF